MVGRSNLVGRPLAALLLERQRHRHRLPLAHPRPRGGLRPRRRPRRRGRAAPRMVRGDWVKPGATVIDVGINRTDGRPRGRRRLRRGGRARGRDHARARRRRPDDDRHACCATPCWRRAAWVSRGSVRAVQAGCAATPQGSAAVGERRGATSEAAVPSKLGSGEELIAGACAILLFIDMFFHWYGSQGVRAELQRLTVASLNGVPPGGAPGWTCSLPTVIAALGGRLAR